VTKQRFDKSGSKARTPEFPKRFHYLHTTRTDSIGTSLKERLTLLQGSGVAESAADLDFPVSTAEEVRNHPQFFAFVMENRDRQYLVDGRMEIEFAEWQSQRKRLAEQAVTPNA
jgi:hypothetical protein